MLATRYTSRSAMKAPQSCVPSQGLRPVHLHRKTVSRSSFQVRSAAVADNFKWDVVATELENSSPLMIVDHALKTFGSDVAIAFSGAEDVALVEYAHLTGRPYRVFSLDTGRLNPETYALFDKVEKHYGIHIEYTFPETQEMMELVRAKGMFSFYEDGHQECCRVRKVRPLRRQLTGLNAWITGQRKDQSPGTRSEVPVVQVDPVFEGLKSGPGSLIKYNPLSNISSAEIWNFLRVMNVPVNELHSKGYISIGCEPCTRPVLPNQHEREGRWWWEDSAGKECGLHSGNIKAIGEQVGDSPEETLLDLWPEEDVKALNKEEVLDGINGNSPQNMIVCLYAPWCPYSQAMEESYSELAENLRGSSTTVAKHQADLDKEFSSSKLGLTTFPTIIFIQKNTPGFVRYPSERRDAETLKMWIKTIGGSL